MQPCPRPFRIAAMIAVMLVCSAHATPLSAQNLPGTVPVEQTVKIIVTLKQNLAPGTQAVNEAAAAATANALGLTPTNTYGTVLFGFSATVPLGRLTALENDPRIAAIELVRPVTATAPVGGGSNKGGKPSDGGDPPASQVTSWGYDRIGANQMTLSGSGIHVYVFDSGIDSDHPDLAGNLAADGDHYAVPAVAATCRGKKTCPPWEDDLHHGTQVAGVIGALNNTIGVVGVAPDTILHAYKVLDKYGNGDDAGVIDAVDHLASRIVAGIVRTPIVANMSFTTSGQTKSGTCSSSGYQTDSSSELYDSYHRVICALANLGVVVVTGAGNSGADAATYVPAAYDDAAIAVSATHAADGWNYLSNWGIATAEWTNRTSAPVAIAAPGEAILTTNNNGGYSENSGTSFAAPHVAAAIALWMQGSGATCKGYACLTGARTAILSAAQDLPTNTSDPLIGQTNPHQEDLLHLICLTASCSQ